MKPWQVDAQSIRFNNSKTDPYLNRPMKEFINGDLGDSQKVVVAPKGYGKTLLLRYRAHQLRKKLDSGVIFYPSGDDDIEYVQLHLDPNEIWRILPRFPDAETWSSVWTTVLLAVGCRAAGLKKFENETLDDVLSDTEYSISDYLEAVLRATKEDVTYLTTAGRGTLKHIFRDLNRDVVLFLDNPDEAFKSKYAKDRNLPDNESVDYDFAQDAPRSWIDLQVGLLLAIREIERSRGTKRLHVYATLRAEALNVISASVQQQTKIHRTDLRYTEEELRQIFYNNIEEESEENFVMPDSLNPIEKWMGITTLQHVFVKTPAGTAHHEDFFRYLLRHSLFSPRDLMDLGQSLSNIDPNVRANSKTVGKEVQNRVNQVASQEIFKIWQENAIPRWSNHYSLALKLIRTNILTQAELKELDDHVMETTRSDNRPTMLFSCYMYQHGLLGYAKYPDKDCRQEFLVAWDQRSFLREAAIPQASHYFLHPVLTDFIRNEVAGNLEFSPDRRSVVGYSELFWPTPPDFVITRQEGQFPTVKLRNKPIIDGAKQPRIHDLALVTLLYAVKEFDAQILSYEKLRVLNARFREVFQPQQVWLEKLSEPDFRSKFVKKLSLLLPDEFLSECELESGEGESMHNFTLGPYDVAESAPRYLTVNFCNATDIFIDRSATLDS